MITSFDFDRDRRRTDIKSTLYRLSRRLFAIYLVLYAIQGTGLFHVKALLRLDLFLFSSLLLGVPLLAFDVDRGNVPSPFQKGIQLLFLVSLLALAVAFSSDSLFSHVGLFVETRDYLHDTRSILLLIAVCVGILSIISIRSNETEALAPVPDLHRQILGKNVTLRELLTVLCLVAILVYYVSIRWPFLSNTFGGVIHSDKYGTHVPILQGMYRTADPFYFQNAAYTSMFDRSSYVYGSYGKVPIFSWGPFPLMPLERHFGIEFVVRSFVTMQGALLLIVLFSLLRELFDNAIALVGTLLLAVNPLFTLVSYLTVMDLPALVLGLASVVLYWRNKKTSAYLLCGLAALTKYSFLLITVPALAILVLTNETEKFYNAVKLGYFTFVPILLFRTLVVPIPGDSLTVGSLRLASFVVLLGASVLIFERYEALFVDAVSRIDRRVRYALMVVVPIIGLTLLWDLIIAYAPHFLTDRYLLFNVNVYAVMLDRVREQMSNVAFFLFPLGVFWILLAGDEKQRTTIVALVFGAAFYAVVASKSVFIHTYYKHVLVFVGIIGFLGVLDAIRRAKLSRNVVMPTAVALIFLLVLSSQAASVALLSDDIRGTEEMGEYIDEHVSDSELVLYFQSQGRLLAIYSDALLTQPSFGGKQAQLESEIEAKGLVSAFRDRNITYYLSYGPSKFEEFKPLLTDGVQTHERRTYILSEINTSDSPRRASNTSPSTKGFFELEARFGAWYLYKIENGTHHPT